MALLAIPFGSFEFETRTKGSSKAQELPALSIQAAYQSRERWNYTRVSLQ